MATNKKSVLVLFTSDNWKKEWPKETKGASKAKYIWSKILRKRNYDLLNASLWWFKEGSFFKYRRHLEGSAGWEDVVGSVLPNVVFDQSRGFHLDTHRWRLDIWRQKLRIRAATRLINLPEFSNLIDNKLNQAVIFSKYMPNSRLWLPGSQVSNPTGKNIVLKKLYGSGGKQVQISKAKKITVKDTAIQQKFISATNNGTLRDIRITFIGDEPQYAYYRIAAKGNLFTNVSMGAKMEFEKLSRLKSLLELSKEVAKPLQVFPKKIYSLDYLVDSASGRPYLIEANTMPGFRNFPEDVLEKYFHNLTSHLLDK